MYLRYTCWRCRRLLPFELFTFVSPIYFYALIFDGFFLSNRSTQALRNAQAQKIYRYRNLLQSVFNEYSSTPDTVWIWQQNSFFFHHFTCQKLDVFARWTTWQCLIDITFYFYWLFIFTNEMGMTDKIIQCILASSIIEGTSISQHIYIEFWFFLYNSVSSRIQ